MRLPLCVAVAAWLAGVGAPAEPSDVPTKRQLGGYKFAQDDEEDRDVTGRMNIIADAIKKLGPEEVNMRMNIEAPQADVTKEAEALNLQLLTNGWTPRHESPDSGLKSSIRLIKWFSEDTHSPVELFELLGIHTAVNEAVNGLLVSYNVKRWYAYMKHFGDMDVHNTFNRIIQNYCGGDILRTHYFLDRLIILEREAGPELEWLMGRIHPKDVFYYLKLDTAKNQLFKRDEALKWIEYFTAYKDVYLGESPGLINCLHLSEATLVEMVFSAETYEKKASKRVLQELLNMWLSKGLHGSEVRDRLGLASHYDANRYHALMKYIEMCNNTS